MRIIGEDVVHEMIIADTVSGMNLSFFYRVPTTSERQKYMSGLWKRTGDDLQDISFETRIKWGKKILTGIGEDQFAFRVEGENKIISSNPKNANYRADWKDLIEQYLAEMLWLLAFRVFEGSAQIQPHMAPRGNEVYDSKN
jgi:hypothetical protein